MIDHANHAIVSGLLLFSLVSRRFLQEKKQQVEQQKVIAAQDFDHIDSFDAPSSQGVARLASKDELGVVSRWSETWVGGVFSSTCS